MFSQTAGEFAPLLLTNLTPLRSSSAGAESRFLMTVSPLTVKLPVASTRSPGFRFEIADCSWAAVLTRMVRVGLNDGRFCVYEIAWS